MKDISEYRLEDIKEFFMQMKANRDAAKDFEQGDYFYWREMECRLKISKPYNEIAKLNYWFLPFSSILFISWLSYMLMLSDFIINYKLMFIILFVSSVLWLFLALKFKYATYLFLKTYKFISNFGNNPLKTTGILLSTILVISLIFTFFALVQPKENSGNKYSNNVIEKSEQTIILDKESSNIHSLKTSINSSPVKQDINLKSNFQENLFHVSCWLISSALRYSGVNYEGKSLRIKFIIIFIQYIFTPLMLALIILSVRRKVKRS